MKKLVTVSLIFILALTVSCKGDKKEKETKEEATQELHEEKHEEVAANAYACPMDCEEGKTYEEEGECPACKMPLKKVGGESNHSDADGEGHSDSDDDTAKKEACEKCKKKGKKSCDKKCEEKA